MMRSRTVYTLTSSNPAENDFSGWVGLGSFTDHFSSGDWPWSTFQIKQLEGLVRVLAI